MLRERPPRRTRARAADKPACVRSRITFKFGKGREQIEFFRPTLLAIKSLTRSTSAAGVDPAIELPNDQDVAGTQVLKQLHQDRSVTMSAAHDLGVNLGAAGFFRASTCMATVWSWCGRARNRFSSSYPEPSGKFTLLVDAKDIELCFAQLVFRTRMYLLCSMQRNLSTVRSTDRFSELVTLRIASVRRILQTGIVRHFHETTGRCFKYCAERQAWTPRDHFYALRANGTDCAFSQTPAGTVVNETAHFKSLEGNLLKDSADRSFAVYLPFSYQKGRKHYPVIYLLHGGNHSIRHGSMIPTTQPSRRSWTN